ncbi:hypothetical protein RvY_03652-2 [Ramazzottius varieornatus]|uniref:G-protein coupled receptors family 1 profile domain-containing protein n=1 Tax=Ramazzottius varieornatus TaxID=947166 RepID=A0A1D1UUH8_RAMVA|nr:hypothetical protein RvY_03652-2 [Ramazzottius varieornatus]
MQIEWRIAFLALRIISVLSNLALAVAVYADRTSKAGPRLLIGNLAVSGFLLSACLFPVMSLQEWMPPGFISSPCAVISVVFFFATAVSWADVGLAVNRTVAICFPFYYDTFRSQKVTWALIAFSWSLSTVIALLTATETGVKFLYLQKLQCTITVTSQFGYFYSSLGTVIPYVFIGTASIGIFVVARVKLHQPPADVVAGARTIRLLKRRLVIAKAMFVSLLWSLICVLPAFIMISTPGLAEDVRRKSWLGNLVSACWAMMYGGNPVRQRCRFC